jgi:2,4-didehydro-3-deoxy-L-rhamnonate hydrolase
MNLTNSTAPVWERPHGWALGSFRDRAGHPLAGLVLDDAAFDIHRLVVLQNGGPTSLVTVGSLLDDWDASFEWLNELAAEIRRNGISDPRWESVRTPLADLRVLAPVQPSGQVFQGGANYRQHVIELLVAQRIGGVDGVDAGELRERSVDAVDERIAQDTPYVFLGLPSAMCGAYDDVVLPDVGSEHDWELELAVVIGRPARRVPRGCALDYVAGYTVCNDVTTRDLVYRPDLPAIGTDWLRSKNAPTFLPTGPFLVPAAFVPDPMDLRITLRLNGQVMQDETTADMIFGIDRLIEHVSRVTEMRPGDMLLTGSPAGNGSQWNRFLGPGDLMEAEISGLGTQRNRCVAEQAGDRGLSGIALNQRREKCHND